MLGLVGLDWGTSTLRAYRLDGAGSTVEARSRSWGILTLPDGGFTAALEQITGGWPRDVPRLACGMVGSRNGWREVPYVGLPAGVQEVAAHVAEIAAPDDAVIHLVPGLRDANGPDVMRGEETQIIGALSLQPLLAGDSTWVLPGTHSKWVRVRDGKIVAFRTMMTGELFEMLSVHSILAVGSSVGEGNLDAFRRGVIAARDSGAQGGLSRLFSVRVLMLDGDLAANEVRDYLSGLLIGEEWRVMLVGGLVKPGAVVWTVGESRLCERYRRAAALLDVELAPESVDATTRGLYELALRAGIIRSSSEAGATC